MVSKDEIKEMEDAGLDVIAINESGKIVYNSAKNSNPNFCDNCRHLRVLPDPDPDEMSLNVLFTPPPKRFLM